MDKSKLKIIFFARLREILALDELLVELNSDEETSVEDILNKLLNEHVALKDYIEQGNQLLIAVNQEISDNSRILIAGDEVALFPPVTGG